MEFVLKKDVEIHRVWKHATGRAANVFNSGYGDADPMRFAPMQRPVGLPEGQRVGTLYV